MASKKSRQTFEKMKREQAVREKRELKRERKEAAKIAKAAGLAPPGSEHFEEAHPGGDEPDAVGAEQPDGGAERQPAE